MEIELHNDNGSSILLDENTLLFVLDETGHEEFKDPSYEIFGIGGCAFNVKDYQRLIEIPFNFMCKKYFPEVVRPWHTADIIKN